MKLPIKLLHDRVDRLEARIKEAIAARLSRASQSMAQYVRDPVGYARDVLKIEPTPDQAEIANAILEPPYRVMVKAGHNVGKTFLAAWLANWWYDSRDPSATITTAPTERDVYDLLWTELRLQRKRAKRPDSYVGPAIAEMKTHEDHYAKGYTARKAESFQGRHRPAMFFIFDEAEGIDGDYWKTAGTMFQPTGEHAWLAILNPTTTTSQSYQEETAVDEHGNPKWRIFTLSSLNHPNITAELAGQPRLIPHAVSLAQVKDWVNDWFEPIDAADRDETRDVEFPPGSGKWIRPGPEGESRVLGRRPSAGTYGVWSETWWERAERTTLNPSILELPEIGCDVARFGDDKTEIHVRAGSCSLHHEEHSGWDTVRTAARLCELADDWAAWASNRLPLNTAPIDPNRIRIKIDDTGVGGGVTDIVNSRRYNAILINAAKTVADIVNSRRYNAIAVNAAETAASDDKYPRCRDEMWFTLAERARLNRLDLTRLSKKTRARLKRQALAPEWAPTTDGRRQVEPKKDTKKRIKQSPDGLDAMNLAYYEPASAISVPEWVDTSRGNSSAVGPEQQARRERERGRR